MGKLMREQNIKDSKKLRKKHFNKMDKIQKKIKHEQKIPFEERVQSIDK